MSYDKNNIFAKIIRGEIPCKKVYENDQVLRKQLRAGITREERQQLAAVLVRLGNNLASVLAEEIETT